MPEYISCEALEKHISFQYTSLLYCTLINGQNGLGKPVIKADYHGEPIDWNEFFKVRNEHRKLFQSGGCIKECENCSQLINKNWTQANEISYILLSTWLECNSRCIYCRPNEDEFIEDIMQEIEEPYDLIPIITDMIKKKILKKDAIIDFAGGEASIHKGFNKLLDLFIKNEYKNIIIHTNAIKYSKAIEKGIKKDVVSLLVSIDAGTKEVHRKIKRVNSYDIVWENLKKYFSAKQKGTKNDFRTKYIIVPGLNDSIEEVDIWLLKSKEIGVTGVVLNLDQNYAYINKNNKASLNKILDLSAYIITKANALDIKIQLYPGIVDIYKICGRSLLSTSSHCFS